MGSELRARCSLIETGLQDSFTSSSFLSLRLEYVRIFSTVGKFLPILGEKSSGSEYRLGSNAPLFGMLLREFGIL